MLLTKFSISKILKFDENVKYYILMLKQSKYSKLNVSKTLVLCFIEHKLQLFLKTTACIAMN